jgi:hypothetical protein
MHSNPSVAVPQEGGAPARGRRSIVCHSGQADEPGRVFAKLSPLGEDGLRKVLWNVYWRSCGR